MKSLQKNNVIFVIVCVFASLFLLASYIPQIYEASLSDKVPQDRVMIWGEHIYTYDYNVYLSKILQGMEGRWSIVDKYTNNPSQKGVLFQMIYLLAGKLGRFLELTPGLVFHLMRTVLSLGWIVMIIYLSVTFLGRSLWYIPAIVVSLLASSFPVIYEMEGARWVGMYMAWWQEMDIMKRISYLPHYTASYIIITLLTILLYQFSKNFNKKYLSYIVGLLFVSFFVHPAGSLLFLLMWFIYFGIRYIFFEKMTLSRLIEIVMGTFFLVVISLVPLLYIKLQTSSYPWKTLVDFDRSNPLPFTIKEYVLSLGPIFFTGFAGIILTLIRKDKKMLIVASWPVAAALGILVFSKFPIQSPVRFVQTANHIPLAILTIYFLKFIADKFGRIGLTFSIVILLGISFLGAVQGYFSIKAQNLFNYQKAVAGIPLVAYPPQVVHPLKDFYDGLVWLSKNTNNNDVVLSYVTAGNYIPAYSGNFVYLGHNPETPDFLVKEKNAKRFYSKQMTDKEARDFLQKEKISYVFWGPQERDDNQWKPLNLSFLLPVYESELVTIYKAQ